VVSQLVQSMIPLASGVAWSATAAQVTLLEFAVVRYVLLDRITLLQPPELARGLKCVTLSDDVFADHFPGHPVMPGALIVESLAQLAGVLLEATMRERGRHDLHALLTMLDRAKFRHVVRPGDRLELEARGLAVSEDGGQAQGWARVDGQLVAEAQLSFAFVLITSPTVLAKRREFLNIWLTGSAEVP
jgi:3-hydroxyacyl-[acyl-carrier-protein] dehydratase